MLLIEGDISLKIHTKFIAAGFNTDLNGQAIIQHFEGTLRLTLPPYPVAKHVAEIMMLRCVTILRMGVSFVTTPKFSFDVVVNIGNESGFSISLPTHVCLFIFHENEYILT